MAALTTAGAKLIVVSLVALTASCAPVTAQAAGRDADGSVFKDCSQCPEMLPVAPSDFLMGDESLRTTQEQPVHRVAIAYRFAYSREKVSVRDWKHCVLAGACRNLVAVGTASAEPVSWLSWVDVHQYLQWLSLETGVEYRLLSEAEWEYLATRASSIAPGFRIDGLEWTSDCWHADYVGAPDDGSSWDAGGDCRYHVARGHRLGDEESSRTKRYRFLFNTTEVALSFRVARTLAGTRP